MCGCGGCDVGPELDELLSCIVPSVVEAQLQEEKKSFQKLGGGTDDWKAE